MSDFHIQQDKLRKEYSGDPLNEERCEASPFEQFRIWFGQALKHEQGEINAMSLATASKDGRVSSRMVLLKDFSEAGFTFFTNMGSRKGIEINDNPSVALLFYWPLLERQVRIEGTASKVSSRISDDYFAQRPRMAQLGAVASLQSLELKSRQHLEDEIATLERNLDGKIPVRPEHWGGYIVSPSRFEFWQGRRDRLHDRICYYNEDGSWRKLRLYP